MLLKGVNPGRTLGLRSEISGPSANAPSRFSHQLKIASPRHAGPAPQPENQNLPPETKRSYKDMLIHTAQWSSPQRVLAGAVAKGIKSLFGPEKNAAQPEKTVSNRITRGVTKPLPWPTGGPPENPTKAPGQRPKFVPPRPEPAIKTKTVEKTEPKPRPKPAPGRIDAIIRKTAQRHNLDADLVRAVVKAESNFNPDAVSHAGAMGLMQLMPGTASDLGVDDPFNPSQNVSGGVRYLKAMLNRYNGDLKAALAAYNWGPGNYDRHGPSSMPSETRNYIRTVTSHYQRFASAKA